MNGEKNNKGEHRIKKGNRENFHININLVLIYSSSFSSPSFLKEKQNFL